MERVTLTYLDQFGHVSTVSFEKPEALKRDEIEDWIHHTGMPGLGFMNPREQEDDQ